MKTEYEVKFLGIDKDDVRSLLRSSGFECLYEEFLMTRKTFHHEPRKPNQWFRIRREQDSVTMTYKRINHDGVDGVKEVETTVGSYEEASQILSLSWLKNTSTQENRREIWRRENVEVCLDTWPWLQTYIEIEADQEETVRTVSKELGFDFQSGVFWGVESVYKLELGIQENELTSLSEISFKLPPKASKD